MKKKKLKRPGKGPNAHGAVKPPVFVTGPEFMGVGVSFGATVGSEDYPVSYLGLKNLKALHEWLGKVIEYAGQSYQPKENE